MNLLNLMTEHSLARLAMLAAQQEIGLSENQKLLLREPAEERVADAQNKIYCVCYLWAVLDGNIC